MKDQKHCMVVHAYYPIGETRVEREALALIDHGIQVDLICLQDDGELKQENVDGVNVYRVGVKRKKGKGVFAQLLEYLAFFALASIKLWQLHRKRHYQIVQVHNLPDWLVFAAWFPKWRGARVILDLHDLMPEFYAARFKCSMDHWAVRLLIWQESISCRFADQVITVTEGWRQTLMDRGVPASKVSVVMNTADERYFFLPPSRNVPHMRNGHFRLMYHGNLTYRYGIDLTIRAVAALRGKIPGIELYIHGGGDARDDLIQLVEALDLKEQVRFNVAAVATSELPDLILKADVCVVPYRCDVFTDGILPTKLMEYATLRMPVVTSRTTAITHYFDETMVQFMLPEDVEDLSRCLLELYQNSGRLDQLSQGIDKFNQHYSWAKQREQYVCLVNQLAN